MRTVLLWLIVLGMVGVATAQAKPKAGDPATPIDPAIDPVGAAVEELKKEAAEGFREGTTFQVDIARPHRVIAPISPKLAHQALRAMSGKLTGQPYRDAFIRYHLMDVVNRALVEEGTEPFIKPLLELAHNIPDDPKIELKPWWVFDPQEIGQRHWNLVHSGDMWIGFPPFQRLIGAPESFKYMNPAQRAQVEKNLAEAKTLEGKFKVVHSVENATANWLSIHMNWVVRQYRGELLYALVAQDDPKALERLVAAICNNAATNPVRATDLVSFLNAAYFDGHLGKYDPKTLKGIAARLRRAAVEYENKARESVQRSGGPPTLSAGWTDAGGRWRQFPEAIFTIVFAIENDRVPKPILAAERVRAPTLPPPKAEQTYTPDTIDLAAIDGAIARGLAALERLRPPDVDLNYNSYEALRLPSSYWYADFTLPGQGALATWAMLATGESEQSTWMNRRVNWVMCYDSPRTYDRAMRLCALSLMPKSVVEPWMKRDAKWLLDTMTEQGNWEQMNLGSRSAGFGDNANGQYAVLGLWAAAQAGLELPSGGWQRVERYWRNAQRPPNAPGAGGWSVTSTAALQQGANLNEFTNQVSSSMTAGGALSLYLAEMYLYGPKRTGVKESLSPDLLRGIDWLDHNFSLDNLDGDSDFYFYTWTIQNVGQATGHRTFNKIDWFREATARLLNAQQADGTWTGPKGPHVSTSFALLYLQRARGPLAICKVRFEPPVVEAKSLRAKRLAKPPAPAWNNRPNDLYNFVTDVSQRTETLTNWQIADLDQPLYQLIETPLLYLATDEAFTLAPARVDRLREYLDAGGTLLCVPEGKRLGVPLNSMKKLAETLCPGVQPLQTKGGDHPFYSLVAKVKAASPLRVYASGTRPRVIIAEKDLGKSLQANDRRDRDAFSLLMNIYLYAAGKDARRARIASTFVAAAANAKPTRSVAAARLRSSNDADPEPLALTQLGALLGNRHDVKLTVNAIPPTEVSAETKIAFLTVGAATELSADDAQHLRDWVNDGGTLWLDAAGGSPAAVDCLDRVVTDLGIGNALAARAKPALFTGKGLFGGYDLAGIQVYRPFRNERGDRPDVRVRVIDDRPAVIVVRGDLMAGLTGANHWGISGLSVTAARRLAVNSVLGLLPPPPPTTAPTTNPTTAPTTSPTSAPTTAPTTNPTTAPAPAEPVPGEPELAEPAPTTPVPTTPVPADSPPTANPPEQAPPTPAATAG